MDKFLAVGVLHLRRNRQICAPVPAQIRDLVCGPDMRRRITMTVQTETHAQRFGMVHFVHLVNASVTFHAAKTARDMHRMVEINVVRHNMHLHPWNCFTCRCAFANQRQTRVILQNLAVTVHARGRRRDVREP